MQSILDRIANDFTYHRPTPDTFPKFTALRAKCHELAQLIAETVPPGREQATSLTRLEETMMHANAGIARQFPVNPAQGA